MNIIRKKTKEIMIGNIKIGRDNPIAIQSMAKVDTKEVPAVISQIKVLERSGCQIIRVSVKDRESAEAVSQIKNKIHIPLVADIHFDYELALLAIKNGADKIRLNPGNIYKKEEVRKIAVASKKAKIPIRVGVNSGSIQQKTEGRRQKTEDAMVESALSYIRLLEGFDFYDIVVSLKASSVLDTILAYREFSQKSDYPLHLGITATGFTHAGIVKSSIGIGALLLEGIGDTFRVSLTANPLEEVKAAKEILQTLNLRNFGIEVVSCPTCGRCEVDLIKIIKSLEQELSTTNCKLSTMNSQPFRVAVMGCVVNGPGEAKEADLGIAFGKKEALFFKKGRSIKKVSYENCLDVLLTELRNA